MVFVPARKLSNKNSEKIINYGKLARTQLIASDTHMITSTGSLLWQACSPRSLILRMRKLCGAWLWSWTEVALLFSIDLPLYQFR